MITVAEYLEWKQPKVYWKLIQFIGRIRTLLIAKSIPFRQWKRLMEERPKPGRGGLLEGEKTV